MEMTSKCMKESEDEQTTIKGKRKEVDWTVFLPDDVLVAILKRESDVFIRYKAKHVCRRWFSVITNKILLNQASFILQNVGTFKPRLVDIREEGEEGLQVKLQDLDIPIVGQIRSWCNEFLLITNYKEEKRCLYVYNLITKEGSYLPEDNASCGGHYSSNCGVALSFDRIKGIYKVVHLFMGRTIECHILILGKDANHIISDSSKWKTIEFPYTNEGQHICGDPVKVHGRYMNWRIHYSNELVSVDTVKEEICIIRLPGGPRDRGEFVCSLFVMGGFLALFDGVSQDKVEIWVLKDFHRVKWEKLQTITGKNKYFDKYPARIIRYRICGMINKRYIILKSMVDMYSYDLKYGVMKKLDTHNQLYTQFQCDDEHCVFHSAAPSLK